MVSAENKPKKKRKDEKKNLCSAWEGFNADNGPNDDNMFYGCQKPKQQVKQKCRYLDEKNIMLSHHLLSEPWSTSSEGSDVAEKLPPGWDASQDNTLSTKSPVALPAEACSLSQSTFDTDCFPTNNNMFTNLIIHKRKIINGLSPVRTSSLELQRTLPLIRWAPATSQVQMTEEPVAWRSKGFVTVNREARPAELTQIWKRAPSKKLEWCQESLARLAHLQAQSPNNASFVARTRPVIRRAAGLTVGHRRVQVQDSHVEQNFCQKAETKRTGLPNGSGSAPLAQTHKQGLWSSTQTEAKHSRELGQQDGGHFHGEQGTISMGCSNLSRLSDTLSLLGYRGYSETTTIPRDVTLFHVLQVLQSKPVNFQQVKVQRRLEAL
ncbi:uncharacterized protein LOC108428976 [Pygocentrus nattereri]|uniref:uncharacterized protein LOC108428976 n=1 Tax=Pygocentrus nattereri TaxID=42514 RepID=UPI001891483B|nr:uncharacterized protein LOC108428976 [Pygocentrus nattereri]